MQNHLLSDDNIYLKGVKISEWLTKYLLDDISDEEKVELFRWVEESEENKALFDRFVNKEQRNQLLSSRKSPDVQLAWAKIAERLQPRKSFIRRYRFTRYAAAVLLLISVSSGVFYFYFDQENESQEVVYAEAENYNFPASNKVYLVTAEGSTIDLTNDTVVNASGLQLNNQNQTLSYGENVNSASEQQSNLLSYNRLVTPRGSEYTVVLPDGSRVHLNAASELKYPNKFSGEERIVFLQGEAYFDVTPGQKAFVVKASGMDVKVLGTSFNVMAYEDEKTMHTTLVKGRVEVAFNEGNGLENQIVSLTPDMQAVYDKGNTKVKAGRVDVQKYIAWTDGQFVFENERLEDILKALERWYDVDFTFDNEKTKNIRYSMDVERFSSVKTLLNLLKQDSALELIIENKTIRIKEKNKI